MGEPEAIAALRTKRVEVEGIMFDLVTEPHGWCDGCYFVDRHICPTLAQHICCTGSVIFQARTQQK